MDRAIVDVEICALIALSFVRPLPCCAGVKNFDAACWVVVGQSLTVTDRLYSPATGRIQTIKTGNSLIQNLAYGFDQLGDLTSRDDGVNNVHEIFNYDALNRLTRTDMTGATGLTKTYGYSSTGNLTYKSDVGTLVYPVTGIKQHAVQSVTGTVNGLVNPTYTYDTVGNLLDEKTGTTIQRSITWTGFNMPLKISAGSSTIDFLYDADHARVKETRMTGATVDSQTYFVNAGNALFFEIETKGTITEWKHYIHAPSGLLMMRSIKSNTTALTDVYFHKDHLGSITTITSNIGAILEQNSFDAFGKRRNSNGSDATTTINSLTRRGFTEHEMLPEENMIHMNGRVYEPTLGRFMSADPQVQFPRFSQSYNRYSYTLNNPLSGTDPTGFGTWSDFRDQILNPTSSTSPLNISNRNSIYNPAGRNSLWWGTKENFNGARSGNLGLILMGRGHSLVPGWYSFDSFNSTHPTSARITTTVGQIACGFTTVYYAACVAGVSAYSTAVAGGGNRDILKSAAIAYLVADASQAVRTSGWSAPVKVFANGVIGGVSADLQGGSFRQGFIYSASASAAREFYISFTGRDPTFQRGENRNDSIDIPCGNAGSNCFEFDSKTGYVPELFGNGNAIGLDKPLSGSFWNDFGKQSGPLSRMLNVVPGMNSLAIFHDTIFGPNGIGFTVYSNVGTMLPAALINYGALLSGPASSELAIKRNANYYQ